MDMVISPNKKPAFQGNRLLVNFMYRRDLQKDAPVVLGVSCAMSCKKRRGIPYIDYGVWMHFMVHRINAYFCYEG